MLAVLTLAVHPFQLPDLNRPIDVELLPPLTVPPTPTVDIELRPRQEEPAPKPRPQAAPQLRPATPEPPPQPQQAEPQPAPPQSAPPELQPLEQARPSDSALPNPVEAPKPATQALRLQTQRAIPKFQALPPEPVTVTRPDAALAPPIDAPKAQAPRRAGPLDTSRAAPQLTQEPPAESETLSTAPPVLTNSTLVEAPVEVRPRERTSVAPGLSTQGAAPQITGPAPGGAAAPSAEAGAPAGGGRPGASRLPPGALEGFKNAPVLRGLHTDLGCENPDTYKLSPEDRAACLDKFAKRAGQGPDLGLNIPARKQAEYDHDVACHKAYTLAGIPGSAETSRGTSIPGMGSGPTLKECGPGQR